MGNIFRTICTKFYQNRPGFVGDVTKTFSFLVDRPQTANSWSIAAILDLLSELDNVNHMQYMQGHLTNVDENKWWF